MASSLDEASISPTDAHTGKEQQAAGVGILLQIMILVLSFVLGRVLRRHKFYYLPEAGTSLLIGLIVGGLANISDTETSIRLLGHGLISMRSSSSCFCYVPLYFSQGSVYCQSPLSITLEPLSHFPY